MNNCLAIDPKSSSIEELLAEKERLEKLLVIKNNEEQAIKIFLNCTYGATGSSYFFGYNISIAEAITLQGQDLIKVTSEKINQWMRSWHTFKELHEQLGITVNGAIGTDCVIYNDTDSVHSSTMIQLENEKLSIEELYNRCEKQYGSAGNTLCGHESVSSKEKTLNYSKEKGLYYAPIKRVIRHKVTKPMFTIKTKSGKKISITGDHSIMILDENNNLKEILGKDLKNGDKIISVNV
jgi:DNA polymerase elongation subunit (family B)